MKEDPLPEGKAAEPLQEGKKEKGDLPVVHPPKGELLVAMWGWAAPAFPAPAPAPRVVILERRDPSHTKREWVFGSSVEPPSQRLALAIRAGAAGPLETREMDPRCCAWTGTSWKDTVPDRRIQKVWDLQPAGWQIHLVSFCGQKRAQEVEDL